MDFGYDRLKQTGEHNSRKKTNNKWFETQDSISYWEDFFKPKIMYPNMTKYLPFLLDLNGFLLNDKGFIITGENIYYLISFLNSSLFKFCYRDNFPELLGGTRELRKIFFDKISIRKPTSEINDKCQSLIVQIQNNIEQNKEIHQIEIELDNLIFEYHELTNFEQKEIGFIQIE